MTRPPIDTTNDDEIRQLIGRLQHSLGFHATKTYEALPVDRADLVAVTELAERSPWELRRAFIAGMDRCRQHYEAYGEWPSLPGRVEIADDEYPDASVSP